jgi:hypothetical protein
MKTLFIRKLDFSVRKKIAKCYIHNIALCMVLKLGHFGKIINTWKILKYASGEGWRRSVGPIV